MSWVFPVSGPPYLGGETKNIWVFGSVGTTELKLPIYASEAKRSLFLILTLVLRTRASHVTWFLSCDANIRP